MGYDIVCPGYTSSFYCSYKKERTGDGELYYGSNEYEKYCKKDYKRGGYGDCPYYQWFASKYIVTAVLNKLFHGKNVPEAYIARQFRTRIENGNSIEFDELIARYDVIGPILAKIIEKNEELAKNIYINTIVPAIKLIYQGKDDEALLIYMKMVKHLIKKINKTLQNSIISINPYIVINQENIENMYNFKQESIKILSRR